MKTPTPAQTSTIDPTEQTDLENNPRPCDATASGIEVARVVFRMGRMRISLCLHHSDTLGLVLDVRGWQVVADTRPALYAQESRA